MGRRGARPLARHVRVRPVSTPATGELFCARDAFGIKPLYYAAEGERILFGSEIKGLSSRIRVRTGA